MITLTIGNVKGGVGKSTIAANLAVEAALSGKRTLLVDADAQASSMAFRAARQKDDIRAISILTPTLHKDIKDFEKSFDIAIIDAGGRDTALFRSAVMAATVLVIPVLPSQYDIWATADAIAILQDARTYKDIPAYFVLNQVITGTKVAKEAMDALGDFSENVKLLETVLHARVTFKNSSGSGQGVTEYEKDGKAAQEVRELYKEILSRKGK